MTDLRAAAELALDVLEAWLVADVSKLPIVIPQTENAVFALRQALAQPEQEPVHFLANGVRYKVTHQGYYGCSIVGLPENLNGQWVALVEATDSKHLNCIAHQESTKPEQQPVAYLCENAVGYKYFRWKKPTSHYKPIALYTAPPSKPEPVVEPANSATNFVESKHLAQPEQEPVAWMYKNGIYRSDPSDSVSPEFVVTPLYTAPPSKPWVSLTDDEIIACGWCDLKFARAIEAALRSKNNG